MTTNEFREEPNDCIELSKMVESKVFQKAVQAVFTDLGYAESHQVNSNPDASERLELRLTNQRKGHTDFLAALRLMCIPLQSSPPVPEMTYGADDEIEKLKAMGQWVPVDQQ